MTTYTIKPGTCGVTGCTETHDAVRVPSIWGTEYPQYRAMHGDEMFIYERWLVDEHCERVCGECDDPAVVYVMGPHAGDWADWYCVKCAPDAVIALGPGAIVERRK